MSTHAFQAEVSQVLRLVVRSLYSNREIFLRELVSNASDALDKLRFRAVSEPDLVEADEQLRIRISTDPEAKTLTIDDNGIGMTEAELRDNLGTIARSGSRELMEQLEQAQQAESKDAIQLIGQFGVGFYSAFLVADRVDVISQAPGSDDAFRWSSDAKESFTIEPAEREGRGTSVVLHLRDDDQDLLQVWRLEELIRRYSDYVQHPIELVKPAPPSDDDDEKQEPKIEQVNQASALWQRSPSEVDDEQYAEFYKHLSHDFDKPLARRHFRVEGTQLFTGLLFVPKKAPFDLFDPDIKRGIRLHVRRVYVMSDCEELLPRWLRFIRGVIDTEDLPLNVSREILQDSRAARIMRKQVINHSLNMIEELADEKGEDYQTFWEQFGVVLKEGLHFDPEYKDRLAKLMRYESSKGEGLSSLAEYVERMPEEQPAIYYLTGTEKRLVASSPHLEALKAKGYEVLFMVDPVDPFAVQSLVEFEGKPLVSAMSEKANLDGDDSDEEKSADKARDEALKPLLERFQSVLKGKVGSVRTSSRLTDSPACLVIPDGGMQPHIERLLRAQQLDVPETKRVLELNADHELIKNLDQLNGDGEQLGQVSEWIELLYDQALLAEGSPIEDPGGFAKRLSKLMTDASRQATS